MFLIAKLTHYPTLASLDPRSEVGYKPSLLFLPKGPKGRATLKNKALVRSPQHCSRLMRMVSFGTVGKEILQMRRIWTVIAVVSLMLGVLRPTPCSAQTGFNRKLYPQRNLHIA